MQHPSTHQRPGAPPFGWQYLAVLTAAAVAGLATPAPAQAAGRADPNMVTRSVAVPVADRTPSTDREAARLVQRLGNAALEACGVVPGSLAENARAIRRSDCWKKSMADAVAQIGDQRLALAAGFELNKPLEQ